MNDRLGAARHLLRVAAGATAASLVLLVAIAVLSSPETRGGTPDPRPGIARATGVLSVALLPSGQPLRAPETLSPALDPRHSAGLPAALEPALTAPPGR